MLKRGNHRRTRSTLPDELSQMVSNYDNIRFLNDTLAESELENGKKRIGGLNKSIINPSY